MRCGGISITDPIHGAYLVLVDIRGIGERPRQRRRVHVTDTDTTDDAACGRVVRLAGDDVMVLGVLHDEGGGLVQLDALQALHPLQHLSKQDIELVCEQNSIYHFFRAKRPLQITLSVRPL